MHYNMYILTVTSPIFSKRLHAAIFHRCSFRIQCAPLQIYPSSPTHGATQVLHFARPCISGKKSRTIDCTMHFRYKNYYIYISIYNVRVFVCMYDYIH